MAALKLAGAFLLSLVTSSQATCLEGNYQAFPTNTRTCEFIQNYGYQSYIKNGDVCMSSLREDSTTNCVRARGFYEATDFCESRGMHLCNIRSIEDTVLFQAPHRNCANNGYRLSQLWTSEPCIMSGGTLSFYTWQSGTVACTSNVDAQLQYLCCGNDKQPYCEQCPANSVEAEFFGAQYCKCNDGYRPVFVGGKKTCVDNRSFSKGGCPANTYGDYPSVNTCDSFGSLKTMTAAGTSCAVHIAEKEFDCPVALRERYIDYDYATSFCTSKGARVCSADELVEQPLLFTGQQQCAMENRVVWSNDRCFNTVEESFWTVDFGTSARTKVCRPRTAYSTNGKKHGIRCCADTVVTQPKCKSCGGGATSNAGTTSFSSCSCPTARTLPSGECAQPVPARASCAANMYQPSGTRACSLLTRYFPDQWRQVKRDVCTSAKDAQGQCFTAQTYAQAVSTCDALGARLCSAYEVRSRKVLRRVGRSCDSPHIWTGTPCCDDWNGRDSCTSTRGHVVMSTLGKRESYQCAPDTQTFKFACCGDKEVASCTNCPVGSTASSGQNTFDSCSCASPTYMNNGACRTFTKKTCPQNTFLGSVRNARQFSLRLALKRDIKAAATSKPGSGTCTSYSGKTYTQAKAICEAEGMRLCESTYELKNALRGRNDECSRKFTGYTWVAKRCGSGRHWVSRGDRDNDACVADSTTRFVVCCADKRKQTCRPCPDDSTSPAGSTSIDACTCTSGVATDGVHGNSPQCVVPT